MNQHQVLEGYIWWGGYHISRKVFEEMLFEKEFDEGDTISCIQLEGKGWYEIYNFGHRYNVFAKDNKRIVLDNISHKIINIYAIY